MNLLEAREIVEKDVLRGGDHLRIGFETVLYYYVKTLSNNDESRMRFLRGIEAMLLVLKDQSQNTGR